MPPADPRLIAHERPATGLIKLATRPERLESAFADCGWPAPAPGRASVRDGFRLLWFAPGACLLKGDTAALPGPASRLVESDGLVATDLGAAWRCWTIQGVLWRELLSSGCPLDVFAPEFGAGAATRTRFGAFDVIVDVIEDGLIDLHVPRSLSRSFGDELAHEVERIAASGAAGLERVDYDWLGALA